MQKNFATYLEKEFLERKKKNPAFSLRAFARLLEIDQSTLSKFFKGHRELSWTIRKQCLLKLGANDNLINDFEEERRTLLSEYTQLEESFIAIMSEWKYWAILEYLKINNSPTEEDLTKRFLTSSIELKKIFHDLTKLGFIESEGKSYKLLKPNNSWSDGAKTSEARKSLQKQLSQLSYSAIEEFSIDSRYHGSLTVAVDKNKLPEIKEKIMNFQAELGQFIQKKSSLNEVYQLTVSFFPLSKGTES